MLLPHVRSGCVLGYECLSNVDLPLCHQKYSDESSRGSGLSSESELDSSEQGEDAGGHSDDGGSAELEEWHGFQDTAFDSADRDDGESKPVLSSDSRPAPVPPSSGTSDHLLDTHV